MTENYPIYPATLEVGDALRYGWTKFKANPGPWIAFTALLLVASCVLFLPAGYFQISAALDGRTPNALVALIGGIITAIIAAVARAAVIGASLDEVDGRPATFSSFTTFRNLSNVLIAALIIGAITAIGAVLRFIPYLGGLFQFTLSVAVGILTMFTIQFVIDQNQDAITALKSGIDLVQANIVPIILLGLAITAITFVGACLCLVGLLVAVPVSSIATTYAYRVLVHGYVSPVAP